MKPTAPIPSIAQEESHQHPTSKLSQPSLVTPGKHALPSEPFFANECTFGAQSYCDKSPTFIVQTRRPCEATPLIRNTKIKASGPVVLTTAQKQRIASNKAIALERRRLFGYHKTMTPPSSPKKSSMPRPDQPISRHALQSTVTSPK